MTQQELLDQYQQIYNQDPTNARNAQMLRAAQSGIDPETGYRIAPDYQNNMDQSTGLLKPSLQTSWGSDVAPNTQAIEKLRAEGLSNAPSSWAQQALGSQALEEQGLKNSTQAQAASAASQARSSLASKYGLSPAAQERLATQNQRSQMAGLQNVGFQGAQARAAIGTQDAANKQAILSALPSQENALAQVQLANKQGEQQANQFNIAQGVNANNAQNAYNLGQWNQGLQGYASMQTGNAMAASGGGGKK